MREPTPDVDFSRLSALEYVAVADRERVHTETLRWLLSDDSPLNDLAKTAFLATLCGNLERPACRVMGASTEVDSLDLVVDIDYQGERRALIFENKLKSSERGQLERYNETIKRLKIEGRPARPLGKYFLTLIGEPPRQSQSDWSPIPFSQLHASLADTLTQFPVQHHACFLREYRDLLARLTRAVALVTSDTDTFARVAFGEHAQGPDAETFNGYVERLRLKTILQRAWMQNLGLLLEREVGEGGVDWDTGETHGNASLTAYVTRGWNAGEYSYSIGIQLQRSNLKVFSAPQGYKRGVTDEQNKTIAKLLSGLSCTLGGSDTLTRPRDRGFSSFSLPNTKPDGFDAREWAGVLGTEFKRLRAAVPASRGEVSSGDCRQSP